MSEKKTYIKYGDWHQIECCKKCNNIMTWEERMEDCCGECGHTAKWRKDLYNKKTVRKAYIYIPPTWAFWKDVEYEYQEKKNDQKYEKEDWEK